MRCSLYKIELRIWIRDNSNYYKYSIVYIGNWLRPSNDYKPIIDSYCNFIGLDSSSRLVQSTTRLVAELNSDIGDLLISTF